MGAACVGLLILGVCVPVPGMSKAEVRARGWVEMCGTVYRGPQGDLWEGSPIAPAWKGRIFGGVGGKGNSVTSVELVEIDDRDLIRRDLRRQCRLRGAVWSCRAAGRSFSVVEPCEGVFDLVAGPTGDGGTPSCERDKPLLDEMRAMQRDRVNGGRRAADAGAP
jgi:hypothetical protein